MNSVWRIIVAIVLIAALFGTVCIGVGFLTGANVSRIHSVLDVRYNVDSYYEWLTVDMVDWAKEAFGNLTAYIKQ